MYHPKGDMMKTKRSKKYAAAALPQAPIQATEFPSLQIAHPLEGIFRDAVDQARKGKGDARHGRGQEFMSRRGCRRRTRTAPPSSPARPRRSCASRNGLEYAQRRTERLGALVYLAMSIIKDDIDHGVKAR
jgi:hypothetical protein